jgi:hypothetical protein
VIGGCVRTRTVLGPTIILLVVSKYSVTVWQLVNRWIVSICLLRLSRCTICSKLSDDRHYYMTVYIRRAWKYGKEEEIWYKENEKLNENVRNLKEMEKGFKRLEVSTQKEDPLRSSVLHNAHPSCPWKRCISLMSRLTKCWWDVTCLCI